MSAPKARRLAAIAKWINENLPELVARIEPSYCNTDRQVGRLRHPGKGRKGNKIVIVLKATGEKVLEHNSAQTYRSNGEVERWLVGWIGDHAAKKEAGA